MTFAEALLLLYPTGIKPSDYANLETEIKVVYRLTRGGFTPHTEVTQITPIDLFSSCPEPTKTKEREPRHSPENLLPKLKEILGKRRWKATPVLMAELKTSRKMLNRTIGLLLAEGPGLEVKGNHHKKYRLAA